MPVFKRPQRTRRLIAEIKNQTFKDFNFIVVGDGDPDLSTFMDTTDPKEIDSRIEIFNLENHEHKFGTQCLNFALTQTNLGEFICFIGNDDWIDKNHLEERLKAIDGTDYDFVFFDSRIRIIDFLSLEEVKYIRNSKLQHGHVGGSELIIRTSFIKKYGIKFRSHKYGHDWVFISDMLIHTKNYKHCNSTPTYEVRHIPGWVEYKTEN